MRCECLLNNHIIYKMFFLLSTSGMNSDIKKIRRVTIIKQYRNITNGCVKKYMEMWRLRKKLQCCEASGANKYYLNKTLSSCLSVSLAVYNSACSQQILDVLRGFTRAYSKCICDQTIKNWLEFDCVLRWWEIRKKRKIVNSPDFRVEHCEKKIVEYMLILHTDQK